MVLLTAAEVPPLSLSLDEGEVYVLTAGGKCIDTIPTSSFKRWRLGQEEDKTPQAVHLQEFCQLGIRRESHADRPNNSYQYW